MAQHQDVDTGTRDITYNLISVLYHSLQGAENYTIYAKDAEQSGDNELASFFRDLVSQEKKKSDRAKQLLAQRLNKGM